jgi:hypothetical protein
LTLDVFFDQTIQLLQCGFELFTIDGSSNLIQFGMDIFSATEFDFLIATARTGLVLIQSHDCAVS